MKLSKEDIENLRECIRQGGKAENAREILRIITDRIIEDCKNEFENLPIKSYQNLDNSVFFMLQLKMKIAKEIQIDVERAVNDAERALQEIKEGVVNDD